VGAVVAVAALSGTIVFSTSLHRLTSTPRLYGQAFQFWMNGMGQSDAGTAAAGLRSSPTVDAITLGTAGGVTINGKAADAIAGQPLQGPLLVSAVKGRVPAAQDEVALGVKTLRDVGAHIGSTVQVAVPTGNGTERTSTFRVVGEVSFPPDFGVVGLNRGAIFSVDGFVAAQCAPGPAGGACRDGVRKNSQYVLLVGLKPGPAGRAALAKLAAEYPTSVNYPVTPANLVNFGQAVNFPLILAIPVVLFGLATIVHVLVATVSRRRREVGLLKSLGFVRRQVASVMGWQATTVAVVGVLVGIPLGVAGGRAVWRTFATNLGVVPLPSVNAWSVVVLAVGVIVAANVLAVAPAFVAAKATPAAALRAE
jgi:predicted lysophospholipase L1 biosynthesis ABC-type transport system permease subunit